MRRGLGRLSTAATLPFPVVVDQVRGAAACLVVANDDPPAAARSPPPQRCELGGQSLAMAWDALVRDYAAGNRRRVTEISDLWGVHKTTASRRLSMFAQHGLVTLSVQGREKYVHVVRPRTRVIPDAEHGELFTRYLLESACIGPTPFGWVLRAYADWAKAEQLMPLDATDLFRSMLAVGCASCAGKLHDDELAARERAPNAIAIWNDGWIDICEDEIRRISSARESICSARAA